jgi:hypothetical protein
MDETARKSLEGNNGLDADVNVGASATLDTDTDTDPEEGGERRHRHRHHTLGTEDVEVEKCQRKGVRCTA